MKKIFIVAYIVILIVLSGCSKMQETNISSERTESVLDKSTCLTNSDIEPTKDESCVTSRSTDEKKDTNSSLSEKEIKNNSSSLQTDKTVSSKTSKSSPSMDSKEIKNEEKTISQQQSSSKTNSSKTQSSQNTESSASKSVASRDTKEIANLVVKYINEHRSKQGSPKATMLNGLSQYDVVRSKQIITNFNHDLDDMRAALASLKYGKYVEFEDSRFDPETQTVIYTGKKISYYDSGAQEAIGRGGDFFKTEDEIAREIANGFRNSSGHWSYLGKATNRYIGCGVTIQNGNWYCCVSVAEENTDLLK